MKLLVLGHSDSDGSRFSNREDGWPWVLQEHIRAETGIDYEVVHRLYFAGPGAVDYLERQVAREQPDVVILALSSYSLVVQLVSNRVREKFGDRAANLVTAGENHVASVSGRLGPRGKRLLVAARRAGRGLVGTRPAMSFEAFAGAYGESFRALARHEDIQTLVLGGLGYARELERLNPALNDLQSGFYARMRDLAEEHHFDWVTHEAILGGREAKLPFFLPDGVHSNEASHRLVAEALAPLVLARQ